MLLDLFKTINDLTATRRAIGRSRSSPTSAATASARPTVVARIGGAEFALLPSETSLETARPVAERLRRRVADTPLMVAAPISFTVSIGVAETGWRTLRR